MRGRLTLKWEVAFIVGAGEGDWSSVGQGTVMGLGKTAGGLSARDSSCGELFLGRHTALAKQTWKVEFCSWFLAMNGCMWEGGMA